jgi:DNA-binding XRE family transcriptional regulator
MSAMHRYATVQHEGVVTHYLVPSAELERLLSASRDKPAATFAWSPDAKQSDFARDVLTDRKTRWESADQFMLELVSEGLREMRERHNMTQQQLAEAIEVTQPHVSRMEQELDGVPLRLLRRIAQVFSERTQPQRKTKRRA